MNVTVVIPTYNERDNLPLLVPDVLSRGDYRVLVVDDDSPDGTGAVADALALTYPGRVDVLHRRGPRGLGLSYIDAFRRLLASDADIICQMDADLSHAPEHLTALVSAATSFDVVVGSRYLHGVSVVNWPLHRIALSTFATDMCEPSPACPSPIARAGSVAGGGIRCVNCPWNTSSPTGTPSSWRHSSRPPAPAPGLVRSRSSSWSVGRDARSSPSRCSQNRSSCRGGCGAVRAAGRTRVDGSRPCGDDALLHR